MIFKAHHSVQIIYLKSKSRATSMSEFNEFFSQKSSKYEFVQQRDQEDNQKEILHVERLRFSKHRGNHLANNQEALEQEKPKTISFQRLCQSFKSEKKALEYVEKMQELNICKMKAKAELIRAQTAAKRAQTAAKTANLTAQTANIHARTKETALTEFMTHKYYYQQRKELSTLLSNITSAPFKESVDDVEVEPKAVEAEVGLEAEVALALAVEAGGRMGMVEAEVAEEHGSQNIVRQHKRKYTRITADLKQQVMDRFEGLQSIKQISAATGLSASSLRTIKRDNRAE